MLWLFSISNCMSSGSIVKPTGPPMNDIWGRSSEPLVKEMGIDLRCYNVTTIVLCGDKYASKTFNLSIL